MPELACFDVASWPEATDDHRALRDAMRRFVAAEIAPFAAEWDEAQTFPRELYAKAGSIGLLGLGYPERFGGTPCDALSRMIATLELTRAGSGGVNASLMSHTIMVGPLLAAAPEALRDEVLPELFAGRRIGALGITEPGGGSDVARLQTRARPAEGGWRISGAKTFITSGMRADHYLIAARTGGPGAAGVSLFLVDRDAEGFTRTPLKKTGWWSSDTATLHFDDVFVPSSRMVGPENGGFALVMRNFNGERLGMAAGALGFAIACVEDALDWARQRETFGQRLIEHQVIRQRIVRMVSDILPALSMVVSLGRRVDRGESPAGEIALIKSHSARVMRDCADAAIQVLGGAGFMRGGRAERIYRDVKVMMIGGGSEEIMNELAARQLKLI